VTRKKLAAVAAVLLLLVLAGSVAFAATGALQAAPEHVPGATPIAATSAYEYVAELSDTIGPRAAGTPAEVRTTDLVSQWFTTSWLLGAKDGYVNTVKAGEIRHSKKVTTISYIEQQLPGRMQAQLEAELETLAVFLTTYTK
jgi:hypothetical protein